MQAELAELKAERAEWERRVSLLRSDRIDPDMLDERARALLELCRSARRDPAADRTNAADGSSCGVIAPPVFAAPIKSLTHPLQCVRRASRFRRRGDLSYGMDQLGPACARRSCRGVPMAVAQATNKRRRPKRAPSTGKRRSPNSARSRNSPPTATMLLIRRFEEKAGQMYGMGLIGGFCHLYIGQEAVVVGMQMALKPGDEVITGYRDHGHMLACGMDPKGVMAELTGRRTAIPRARAARCTCSRVEKGFYGGHGIVGAQVPLGTGLAFANHYRGNDNVCLTYFGDGAANQGQVYESFNMAELWKLPVIYVIENNRYAMGTSITRSSAKTDLRSAGCRSTFRASRSTAWMCAR